MMIQQYKLPKLQSLVRKYNRKGGSFTLRIKDNPELVRRKINGIPTVTPCHHVDLIGSFDHNPDYQLIAIIEHHPEGNIVYKGDAKEWIDTPATCTHCNHRRNRKMTYIVEHRDTSERLQIGSTCLKDFFNDVSAADLLGQVKLLKVISDAASDEDSGPIYYELYEYLAQCCHATRLIGFYPTSDLENATRDTAHWMTPTETDYTMAREILDWVTGYRELHSNYMINVHSIVTRKVDYIEPRHRGLIAALPNIFMTKQLDITPNPTTTVTEGRQQITGTIIKLKTYPGYMFGDEPVLKMTILSTTGCKYFGTVPKQLSDPAVGDSVTVTGTVEVKDPHFGIFRRPHL